MAKKKLNARKMKEKRRARYLAEKEKVTECQLSEALNLSNNRALQNDDTFATTSPHATVTQDNEKTAITAHQQECSAWVAFDSSFQTTVREDTQPTYVTADQPGCSHWRTVDRLPTEANQDNQQCDTSPTEVCRSTDSVLDRLTLARKRRAEWFRKQYHTNKLYREKQKRNALQHYANQRRAHIKALNQAHYRMNSSHKQKLLQRSKDFYTKNKKYREKKKEQSIIKYAENQEHRDMVKEQSIIKYAENQEHRDMVKEQSIIKYAENQEHRDMVKEQSIIKYAENQEHRDMVKEQSIIKYAENQEHRDMLKEQSIIKYAENQEHRDMVKEQSIIKYAENEEHRDRVKEQSIIKYAENQEHRDRVKEQSIIKYAQNEEHRDRVKEQSKSRYQNEDFRARVIESGCTKYRTNKTYRENIKLKAAIRYKTKEYHRLKKNIQLAKRIKQRYQIDDLFRNRLNTLKRKRYETQSDEQKQAEKRRRIEVRQSRDDMRKVIEDFREACKKGPDYTCSVCNRLLFEKQVKECEPHKYTKNEELSNRCINEELLHICNESCEDECEKEKMANWKAVDMLYL